MAKNISFAREAEIMEEISAWNGEINTALGLLLRKKLYTCFNSMIYKIGEELSAVLEDKKCKDKSAEIKKVLIKYNIYVKKFLGKEHK